MLLAMFKSSEEPLEDPYLLACQSSFPSLRAEIISPHEFRPCHQRSSLSDSQLDFHSHEAVIFTSARAVQYFADASLAGQRLICYAVGAATAEAARRSGAGFLEVRGGAACGNAAALCDLVAAELRPGTHRLLFPCGRVRKDTVESRLGKELGFSLTVVEVYDALEKETLSQELETLLSTAPVPQPCASSSDRPILTLAFFSPSSASMVLKHFNSSQSDWDVKYIAIGPSTSQRLRELLGKSIVGDNADKLVECKSPSVEGFVAALTLAVCGLRA